MRNIDMPLLTLEGTVEDADEVEVDSKRSSGQLIALSNSVLAAAMRNLDPIKIT